MRNNTLRFISKVLLVVMVLSIALEAPLSAATPAGINVNVGGQTVNVTPGSWIKVVQGTQTVNYNVRYVDGQPVALEMSQYIKLIFGGGNAGTAAATTGQSNAPKPVSVSPQADTAAAPTQSSGRTWDPAAHPRDPVTGQFVSKTPAPANTGTVAPSAPVDADVPVVSGTKAPLAQAPAAPIDADVPVAQAPAGAQGADTAKAGGSSWIKDELSGYGKNIKDSFTNGKANGQEFGTKTVDGAKAGAAKVGEGVKTAGSKIGDLLKGAKDRIASIFRKNTPAPKPDSTQSGQSGQAAQGDDGVPANGTKGQPGQSGSGAQSGQSGQSEQGNQGQPGQSGSGAQSGQSGQSGQGDDGVPANQGQPGQSGSGAQSGQSGQSDQGTKKPGFFDKTGEKFKDGYSTGKAMTNEGFQNVKDSLKSGFSPKNLLMTAGITVGVDLANQIMKGEKPSLGKAVKVVCSAEFAGGVVGSVGGAAAGSFFIPFLSAIPVVGGVLSALAPTFGSIVGGSVGAYLAGDLKNGKFSLKAAFKQIDWVGVGGQTVGSTVGAMLGSMILPPIGTIIGGMVGGFLGNKAAHWIAGLFGKGQGNTNIGYPGLGQPVAVTPDQTITIPGSVGISGDAGVAPTVEIPVSGNVSVQAPVAVAADQTIGTYGSEVQLAYAKYQELYRLYNELLNQGRQDDAQKVATEMNKAKGEYDTLKANSAQ